jgi:hypothetical protein
MMSEFTHVKVFFNLAGLLQAYNPNEDTDE